MEIILADCNIEKLPYSYSHHVSIDSKSKVWMFERHIECLLLHVFASMRRPEENTELSEVLISHLIKQLFKKTNIVPNYLNVTSRTFMYQYIQ